jgi:probable F420-dependent oxidoreductase
MQIGLVVPQTELPDPFEVVELAERAEHAGFHHLVVYDHVLGIDRAARPDFVGPYDVHDPFHEPLVLLGHLAARCRLELWTGVLVLPQRQTAVVAKQAAEVDLLCRGRLRLGVGIGWNAPEYEALGEDFADRARRYEEQVEVLRRFWTEEVVTFDGRYHKLRGVGMRPLPCQRPIPLWMGGLPVAPVLERIGRLADGWIAMSRPGPELDEAMAVIRAAAVKAGRAAGDVGLHGIVQPGADASAERVRRQVERWRQAGASHLSVSGMGAGRRGEAHVEFVETVAEALELR